MAKTNIGSTMPSSDGWAAMDADGRVLGYFDTRANAESDVRDNHRFTEQHEHESNECICWQLGSNAITTCAGTCHRQHRPGLLSVA